MKAVKKKKKKTSKNNMGLLMYTSPADVIKRLNEVNEFVADELTTVEILNFDHFFDGLKEHIAECVKKGLRSNQLVIAIDKKLKEFKDHEEFFKSRLVNLHFRLAFEVYLMIKGLDKKLTEEEKKKAFDSAEVKEKLLGGLLVPLMHYDHKVEVSIMVENIKVIFTFYDEYNSKIFVDGDQTGCMYMITKKKYLLSPINSYVRNHNSISYRVIQTKEKVHDDTCIEASISYNKAPVIFGYYSI